MPSNLAVTLGEVPKPNQLGYEICEERVVETVEYPGPKRVHLEEDTFLAKLVKLRIAVEKAG